LFCFFPDDGVPRPWLQKMSPVTALLFPAKSFSFFGFLFFNADSKPFPIVFPLMSLDVVQSLDWFALCCVVLSPPSPVFQGPSFDSLLDRSSPPFQERPTKFSSPTCCPPKNPHMAHLGTTNPNPAPPFISFPPVFPVLSYRIFFPCIRRPSFFFFLSLAPSPSYYGPRFPNIFPLLVFWLPQPTHTTRFAPSSSQHHNVFSPFCCFPLKWFRGLNRADGRFLFIIFLSVSGWPFLPKRVDFCFLNLPTFFINGSAGFTQFFFFLSDPPSVCLANLLFSSMTRPPPGFFRTLSLSKMAFLRKKPSLRQTSLFYVGFFTAGRFSPSFPSLAGSLFGAILYHCPSKSSSTFQSSLLMVGVVRPPPFFHFLQHPWVPRICTPLKYKVSTITSLPLCLLKKRGTPPRESGGFRRPLGGFFLFRAPFSTIVPPTFCPLLF